MTNMKAPYVFALAAISLLGCITTSCVGVTYTKYKDEPRQRIRFSSTAAAQTFYDAYASIDRPQVRDGRFHSIKVYAGLVSPYSQHTKTTENIGFNAAVQRADANRNGTITEKEARAYAAKVAADPESSDSESSFH